METPQASDTIDLPKTLVHMMRLVAQNVVAVLLVVALCFGGAILYYLLAPKVFESKMIIQSDILSESYSLKLAENLNTHIRDGDLEFLVSTLNITDDEANHLQEFKIVSALTPMSQQMAEKEKIIVVITVRVNDNALLPKLQQGILHYFNSNEYIKKRVDENRRKYEGLIYALDVEIRRLDTLKNKISAGEYSNAKAGGISFVDVAGLYGVAAALHEKRADFMVDLATVDSIQVIEGFTPYSKAVWPKLSIVLVVSMLFAAIFSFVFISYRHASRKP